MLWTCREIFKCHNLKITSEVSHTPTSPSVARWMCTNISRFSGECSWECWIPKKENATGKHTHLENRTLYHWVLNVTRKGIPSTIVDIHTSQYRGQLWFSFLHTHQQFHFTKIFTVAKPANHLQLFNQGKPVIFILTLLKNESDFFFCLFLYHPSLFSFCKTSGSRGSCKSLSVLAPKQPITY